MADKILVVDDEREIADLIEVYLRNEDYRTVKCGSGYHAAGCERVYDLSEDQGEIYLSDHHADGEG